MPKKKLAWNYQKSPTGKDEWITPQFILAALKNFDLDPCAAINQPWQTATKQLTIQDDGLNYKWHGRVWCNPPYSAIYIWMRKMAEHNNGIALTFARTETKTFFDFIWPKATAIMFLKRRLTFFNVDGTRGRFTCGGPSVLVAYGEQNAVILKQSGLDGRFICL